MRSRQHDCTGVKAAPGPRGAAADSVDGSSSLIASIGLTTTTEASITTISTTTQGTTCPAPRGGRC